MNYSLHKGAEEDLAEVFRFYRREAGDRLAGGLLEEFERVIRLLEELPDIGKQTGVTVVRFRLQAFHIP